MSAIVRPRSPVASATPAATRIPAPTPAREATVPSLDRVADKTGALVCEISARSVEPLDGLELIARLCARDVGQSLVVKARTSPHAGAEPVITLHLPAELAASQHPAWCLACRLACFCPQARVSVLVSAAAAFAKKSPRRTARHAA